MTKLLFDRPPLVIDPVLASIIGLHEAIILQQIHYWLEINKKANRNFHDGRYWTYNSYENWQSQFPFWNVRTIKSIIAKLENQGLLLSGNFNKLKFDRTKWYTINYEALNSPELFSGIGRAKPSLSIVQDLHYETGRGSEGSQGWITSTERMIYDPYNKKGKSN